MLFYRKCGTELVGDEKFCPNCGTPVRRAKIEAEPTAEPPQPQPRATRKAVLISIVAILVIGAMIATIFLVPISGERPSFWFSDDWAKRRSIIVNNSSSATLGNYQVKIDVPYDDDMQSDFDDLRFALENGDNVPYWVENYSAGDNATVWVRVPTIPALGVATIYMYYGNQNAAKADNGEATFEFFDDFPGTGIDNSKWTGDLGHVFVSDSIMTLTQEGIVNKQIQGTTTFSYPLAVEMRSYHANVGAPDPGAGLIEENFGDDFAYFQYATASSAARLYTGRNGSGGYTVSSFTYNAFRHFTIIWTSFAVHFYDEGVEMSGSPRTSDIPIDNMAAYFWTGGDTGDYVKADWIALRKHVSPEPEPSVGIEISKGTERTEADSPFLWVAIAVLWASIIAVVYLILRSMKQH